MWSNANDLSKYATLILGLAIVLASIAAANAKLDRKCLREICEACGAASAKRICNPKNYVTNSRQYGWERQVETGTYRVKGRGAKRKRDAVCE
jgi:hypothetical protein